MNSRWSRASLGFIGSLIVVGVGILVLALIFEALSSSTTPEDFAFARFKECEARYSLIKDRVSSVTFWNACMATANQRACRGLVLIE